MSRIAIFGGLFDPPHIGHIHAAVFLREAHGIDSVYVIPAYGPLTKASPRYSPQKRLQMTRLAFGAVPHCTVLDLEIAQNAPCFTIDTVQALIASDKAFAAAQRFCFLGADAIPTLHLWKDVRRLFSLVIPLFAARAADPVFDHACLPPDISLLVAQGRTEMPLLDISSTLIKARLAQNKYVGHLLPQAVLESLS